MSSPEIKKQVEEYVENQCKGKVINSKEEHLTPLQKPFLNTKDTKVTKEIQRRFENVKLSRKLS